MELSSDEKCAIDSDVRSKTMKEGGETLSFGDVSKTYGEKYKSDLKQWKEEFTNFGAFLSMASAWMLLLWVNLFRCVPRWSQSQTRVHYLCSIYQNRSFRHSLGSPKVNSGIKELIIAFGVTKWKARCPQDYIRNQ